MFPGIPVQKNLRYHLQQDEDLQNETNIKYTHIENNEVMIRYKANSDCPSMTAI